MRVLGAGLAICVALSCSPVSDSPPTPQPAIEPQPASPLDESQLQLAITSVEERNSAVVGEIETNIPLPVEVALSLSLRGQADEDTFIGNDARLRITTSPQRFSIPTLSLQDQRLPAGEYDVEVSFYPRWGAENGPEAARSIGRAIHARRQITLHGSGVASAEFERRLQAQQWVMENIYPGVRWDARELERRLGPSERMNVTNRTSVVVAYYYPNVDITIFVSTALNEVLIWRRGRTNRV